MYTNFIYVGAFIRHIPIFLYHTFFVAFWQSWKLYKIPLYGKIMKQFYTDFNMKEQRDKYIKTLYTIDEYRMLQIRSNTEQATAADIWKCSRAELHTDKNTPIVTTSSDTEISKPKASISSSITTK